MKYKPIYIITTFEKLEEASDTFPELGDKTTIGFYYNLNHAKEAVEDNICDIWEECYNYALIEEAHEGMYNVSLKRWLYKFNKSDMKYHEVEEPEFFKKVVNWAER